MGLLQLGLKIKFQYSWRKSAVPLVRANYIIHNFLTQQSAAALLIMHKWLCCTNLQLCKSCTNIIKTAALSSTMPIRFGICTEYLENSGIGYNLLHMLCLNLPRIGTSGHWSSERLDPRDLMLYNNKLHVMKKGSGKSMDLSFLQCF